MPSRLTATGAGAKTRLPHPGRPAGLAKARPTGMPIVIIRAWPSVGGACHTPGMSDHERTSAGTGLRVRGQLVGTVAGIARLLGTVAAVLLTLHVILTVCDANPGNGITRFVAQWSSPVALWFKDLFTPADFKLKTLVNYGAAAISWLIVTSIVVRIIRRLG